MADELRPKPMTNGANRNTETHCPRCLYSVTWRGEVSCAYGARTMEEHIVRMRDEFSDTIPIDECGVFELSPIFEVK